MPKPQQRSPDRESHTPSFLLWTEAHEFIMAANEVPRHRTPRLHLAGHGTELALKAHLRAKGHTLSQLRALGHSLDAVARECMATGMAAPSDDVMLRLAFLGEAHANHEWRYAHLDHPPHMDRSDWIVVAEWALRSAIPAVAKDQAKTVADELELKRSMGMRTNQAANPNVA